MFFSSITDVAGAGLSLSLEIMEHCLEKNKLKSSAFSLKSAMKRLSYYNGEIRGASYYLRPI